METVHVFQNEIIELFFKTLSISLSTSKIAVRLRDEKNRIPFYKWKGYDDKFIAGRQDREKDLTLAAQENACLCYAVLKKELEPYREWKTEYGSFISNNLQTDCTRLRERGMEASDDCVREGFQSLGLVPFDSNDGRIQGLFHLADDRPGIFSAEKVADVEQISKYFLQMLLQIENFISVQKSRKYRILIAEDDEAISHLLNRVLTREGHSCTSMANGQKALDYLNAHRIDLLLTDINMPVMDGAELIREIRERYGIYGPKIIVLTAYKPGLSEEFVRTHHVAALLHKPLDSIFEINRVIQKAFIEV